MTDDLETLDKTWEFKGIEIMPLSLTRKSHIFSLLNLDSFGVTDAAAFIYGCTCPPEVLRKGRRKPDEFDKKVEEWIEEIQYDSDDYPEAARLFKEIMEYANANKAMPITDPSLEPDPVGN
jgi:hypothetical protein